MKAKRYGRMSVLSIKALVNKLDFQTLYHKRSTILK